MYEKELIYVKEYLINHNGDSSPREAETFRKRSNHVNRVYKWANRIYDLLDEKEKKKINLDALYLASIFHDVGYGSEHFHNSHPIEGKEIWIEYAKNNNISSDLTNEVADLILNHQNKKDIKNPNLSPTLVLLMEADMLDEEGTMSIIWDAMVEGQSFPQDYDSSLERIKKYTAHILEENPMINKPSIKFWADKQKLVKEFIDQLEFDLFIK